MKQKYLKFCNFSSQACGAFAVLALLLSILVIVELVFERYFFQRAITWQTELVTMLLVASTFIGSAYVLSEKAHVSMEWIYDFLSKNNILRLKIFTSLISLLFFLILFYFGYLMVEEAFTKNPQTPKYSAWCVFGARYAIEARPALWAAPRPNPIRFALT